MEIYNCKFGTKATKQIGCLVLLSLISLTMSGCALFDSWADPGNEFTVFGSGRVNISGPNQMIEPKIEHFTDDQLAVLVDPAGKRFNDTLIRDLYDGQLPNTRLTNARSSLEVAREERRVAKSQQDATAADSIVQQQQLLNRRNALISVQSKIDSIKKARGRLYQLVEWATAQAEQLPAGDTKTALQKAKQATTLQSFYDSVKSALPSIDLEYESRSAALQGAREKLKNKPNDPNLHRTETRLIRESGAVAAVAKLLWAELQKPIGSEFASLSDAEAKASLETLQAEALQIDKRVRDAEEALEATNATYERGKPKYEAADEKLRNAENRVTTIENQITGAAAKPNPGTSASATQPNIGNTQLTSREALERALLVANTYGAPENHRNGIQDRLMVSSEQACNFYKEWLQRIDSFRSFGFGTLATILGGAAAIVTGAGAARALGGAAGIISGTNAEFGQAFFKNVAVQVITPGMEVRRQKRLESLRKKQSEPIDKYNVQAAIRDVLEYHDQCTINAGLEEAKVSIVTVNGLGLDTALATAKKIQQMQAPLQMLGATAPLGGTENDLPTIALEQSKQIIQGEASKILTTLAGLTGSDLKDKVEQMKNDINTRKVEATNQLDTEKQKADQLTANLNKKSGDFAAATDDRTHSQVAGELLTAKLDARALSQKLRGIAETFKAYIQQQTATLDGLRAASQAAKK